jgi:hypothetical protein
MDRLVEMKRRGLIRDYNYMLVVGHTYGKSAEIRASSSGAKVDAVKRVRSGEESQPELKLRTIEGQNETMKLNQSQTCD